MIHTRRIGFGLPCAALAAASLAGCGVTMPAAAPPPPAAAQPLMKASSCGPSVAYVTSYDNSVYIYDQQNNGGTACGQITGLTNPQGIFVDKQRNLWVAIGGNCKTVFSSVFEFAPGGTTPIKTLQDPAGSATDVVVDNRSGTVYVTNFFNYTKGCASGNNGAVEVYAGGSTTPTSTLSDSHMNYAFNDAIDDQGNLYVTYLELNGPTGSGHIFEWHGGSGSPADLGITLQAPGGIQTTKNGALLVCDQLAGCGDFEPGSTTMSKRFATQSSGAFGVALDRRERHAWVENPGVSSGQLQRWKYPGPDKRPSQAITVPGNGYSGVAVSPASPQGKPY